jgi:hypothetical protein
MTFAIMFKLDFFNFKIKLWQLLIKLIHLLYWYIVESIFQLHGHYRIFPTSTMSPTSTSNYVGKQCEARFN